MKFKTGDIVYCIDKESKYNTTRISSIDFLQYDTPYTILTPNGGGNDLEILENQDVFYNIKRFISEKEYNILTRKEKLIKLKDGIKSRRHNLLC